MNLGNYRTVLSSCGDTVITSCVARCSLARLIARVSVFCIAMLLATFSGTKSWSKDVSVWIYHNFPPYIVNSEEKIGLSYDLADLFSEMSDGEFKFNVEVLPRQRLNIRLNDGADGVVFWVNNAWFGDSDKSKYLWTDPILHDQNVVISPSSAPVEYTSPQSLRGMTLVAVRGHFYSGVDELVNQGLVYRNELNAEGHLVRYIGSGRGEVAIIANSAAQYFIQNLGLENDIFFSPNSHSTYNRHVLVQPHLGAVNSFLNKSVAGLSKNPAWVLLKKNYGLK